MKKIIFGIFAHPDDEAIAAAGALLTETKAGNEVHLVLLTAGDAGTNLDDLDNLGETRLKEWHKASKLIGASSNEFLDYKDGQLNNQSMIEISQRLINYIRDVAKDQPDIEIELMSLDLGGFTGHIDHIVAARASCYVFYRLKQQDVRFTRIRLACFSSVDVPESNINWIYMDAGRNDSEINETVDARAYRAEILEIIRAHHTQRSDGEGFITQMGDRLGLNYFVVKD
jgi:LmbE family N-acetylglucosaminyl deacetylase